MSIFNRVFGKREADDGPDDLVAGPKKDNGPALQVLFGEGFKLDASAIADAMRAYHPSMADARCELAGELADEGKIFGLAGWGKHVIQIVGFDVPMPADAVEMCIAPSHYPQDVKQQGRAHKAHVLLWYAGHEESVLEQYTALAAFAGVLDRFGAILVLNESAHTSFPTSALSGKGIEGDMMELLRTLPLPILYCGFVKYNVPEDNHVWMRTYGAHVLGLPDLAVYANGHDEGQHYFDLFDSIFNYMLNSGKRLADGHTMQIGEDEHLRCRASMKDEPWLEGKGECLVVEVVQKNQIK